jgi:hypothetical protein
MTGVEIYLVNDNHCGDCGQIRGVFGTLQAARDFTAQQPSHALGMGWTIEEWQQDEPLDSEGLSNFKRVSD